MAENRASLCHLDGCKRSNSFRYRLANHYYFCNKEHLEAFNRKLAEDLSAALAIAKIIEDKHGATKD